MPAVKDRLHTALTKAHGKIVNPGCVSRIVPGIGDKGFWVAHEQLSPLTNVASSALLTTPGMRRHSVPTDDVGSLKLREAEGQIDVFNQYWN